MLLRGFLLLLLQTSSSSNVFIIGVLLAHIAGSSHLWASAGKCDARTVSQYKHCVNRSDGVDGLRCFGKYNSAKYTCVWKTATRPSAATYTLVLLQQSRSRNYCYSFTNVSVTSVTAALYKDTDLTARVVQHDAAGCSAAEFSAAPDSMWHCDAPSVVSFRRSSGRLSLNVGWKKEDEKAVESFSVRYKTERGLVWSESRFNKTGRCEVGGLNSSEAYAVQVHCITNDKCSQCVPSHTFTVAPELTKQPVIVGVEESDIAGREGCRLLVVTWQFPDKYDVFNVSVGKETGERPLQQMNISHPELRLILSHSSYRLYVSAVNSVSSSPSAGWRIPPRRDELGVGGQKLNVTVHSNTSFTVYWKDDLIRKYVCFSVEWSSKGERAMSMPFYQNEDNHRTLTSLPEPLQPFRRYSITLHTRPNKNTCNLERVNNSESTYGSTHFYSTEGSPVSAPANISSSNVTQSGVVLQWSSIPEDDIRGFLLGYVIYLTEYRHGEASANKNVTVDAALNSFELGGLKRSTTYTVQVSGFTKAGIGVRSKEKRFKTSSPGVSYFSSYIIVFVVMATVLFIGSPIIKRAKVVLWPSIPNPGNSNAMRKIDGPVELELLEYINTLKVEEMDTDSLQIIKREDVPLTNPLSSMLPLLPPSDYAEDFAETTHNWIMDSEGPTGDDQPHTTAEVSTDIQTCPLAFGGGYTTMEMFQQTMPQGADTPVAPESQSETMTRSTLDYVRQFSTSPVQDSEMSIRL